MSECTLFQIGSRDGSETWDVRDLATSVKLTTDADFSAGTLTFDLIEVQGFTPFNGNLVQFQWDNQKVFYGYVFKVDYKSNETFSVTAYDKRRYLKNQDSLVWPVGTLDQRFETCCKYIGMPHKVVDSSSYKLPAKVSDGESYFDMLKKDADSVRTATGDSFVITDNYGTLELHKTPIKDLNILVGDKDGQVVTDWEYDRSIDDAFNSVKVAKSDEKDKKTTISAETAQSGGSIAKWGPLQEVVRADNDKSNAAQMKAQAQAELKAKNAESHSLKISTLGSLDFAVGNQFSIQIQSLTDVWMTSSKVTITSATQNFGPTSWTTDMEVTI